MKVLARKVRQRIDRGIAQRVARRFVAGYSGPITTIEIDLPAKGDGAQSLVDFLKYVRFLGGAGASRGLEVGGVSVSFWDGDGADQIVALRQDGEPVEKTGEREQELLRKDHG